MAKISIITVNFNNGKYLEEAIRSVLSQRNIDLEYILIDGNSADSSVEIIAKYKNDFSKLVVESDNGVYDAMAKGLELATGDIIGFLNSDDLYAYENCLSDVVSAFEKSGVDCLYGDLKYVAREKPSKVIRGWISGTYIANSFEWGWHPPHPSFFAKKNVYQKFGSFNQRYKIAADFDIMYRLIEKHKLRVHYLQKFLVHMREGGLSNKNIKNILNANLECFHSIKANGGKPNFLFPIIKPVRKIKQFFV